MNDYCKGVIENAVSFADCEGDDNEGEENENLAQYDWFTYDMEEADDAEKVCAELHKEESYAHVYDSSTSGSWYQRDKTGQIIRGEASQGLSAGAIAGITIGVLALIGVIAAAVGLSKKNKKTSVETDYQGGALS